MKVKDVVYQLESPVEQLESTVDSLLFGNGESEVSGILVTFVASQFAIKHAQKIGANMIITHEGIFYSHKQNDQVLINNGVYAEKLELIKNSGIAIYRFHDHVHKYTPDLITEGLIDKLEWTGYLEKHKQTSSILNIPPVTGEKIVEYVKQKLSIPFVRVVGDLSSKCSRIGVSVGFRGGGETAIPLFEKENVDLIITGEGQEWETPEYIRDAGAQGKKKVLIMIGHAASEEPGMEYLAEKIKSYFPAIQTTFLSNNENLIHAK
ncbi:Nif3-like dinuclear metal center hexameric protein [Metabacillus halosaccharovorans]|uniref:Nif3-like dinuclear metal center hexameric protein n=1 Tax=Metabacillus halosaccharovorans TaxID=930124 RepID=UPI0031F8D4F5